MGLMKTTYLDGLTRTNKAALTDESTRSLRRSGHITNEDREAIQCNQINASNGYKDNCTVGAIKAQMIDHEVLPKEALKPP